MSRMVLDTQTVFCGKCGTPNPIENSFCRKCGHRLADDIIHQTQDSRESEPALVSPVEDVEIIRFPLIDPETGHPIPSQSLPPPSKQENADRPPHKRGSIILWSFGIHLISIFIMTFLTTAILSQTGKMPSPSNLQQSLTDYETLRERHSKNELDSDAFFQEQERILKDYGLFTFFLYLSGPLLLSFLISGFVIGKIWRPQKLLDVGFAGLLLGGMCTLLCSPLPWIWIFGFFLTLLGTALGRR